MKKRCSSLTNFTLVSTNYVDDGAVYYLNGVKAGALRMTGTVSYTTTAGNQPAEGAPEILYFTNSPVVGDNVVAVEVHQSAANSDDMAFGLELNAKIPTRAAVGFVENPEQWIELHNRGTAAISLEGWSLDTAVGYQFSNSSVIKICVWPAADPPIVLAISYAELGHKDQTKCSQ